MRPCALHLGKEDYNLLWSPYDDLGVFYSESTSTDWKRYELTEGEGKPNAKFSGDHTWNTESGEHNFYAFYPYEQTAGRVNALPFVLPEEQNGNFGLYQKNTAHSVVAESGTEQDVSFIFSPALSLIRLKLTSPTPLVILSLRITAKRPIAGAYTLNVTTGDTDTSLAEAESITITFPENTTINTEEQSIFTVALPANPAGTSISVTGLTPEGNIIPIERKGVDLKKGKIYTIETSISAVPLEEGIYYSADEQQWTLWETSLSSEMEFPSFKLKTVGQNTTLKAAHLKEITDHFRSKTDIRYTLDMSEATYENESFPNIFSGGKQLKAIYLPNNIKELSYAAFRNSSPDYVFLPDGLETIAHNALVGCSLDSIRIPSSLKIIDQFGLAGNDFETLELPEGLKTIGYAAFNNCKKLKEVIIPESLEQIDGSAFRECDELRYVYIPDGVTKIESNLFLKDYKLEEIRLPTTAIGAIEGYAFTRCYALKSITIPSGINMIKEFAFSGCLELKTIICNATTAPQCQKSSGIFGVDQSQLTGLNVVGTKKLIVPAGATGYEDATTPDGSENYWKTELIDKCGYTIEYR